MLITTHPSHSLSLLASSHSLPLSLSLSLSLSHIPFVKLAMRDRRLDRFVILPFSIGCVSQSSVAVCESQPKRTLAESAPSPSGDGAMQSSGKLKNWPNISVGFQKLIKSFKSLSEYIVFDKEEDEEVEVEMEIGFPTDVQHVAHIGWDGFNSTSSEKSWGTGSELLNSLPSFSLKQFELAMAAQAAPPPHGPPGSWP